MDFSRAVTPFIGIVTPLVILWIRRPITRIDDSTKWLQLWKTHNELAGLLGETISGQVKQASKASMLAAEDTAQNLSNKLVGFVANSLTIGAIYAGMAFVSVISVFLKAMNFGYKGPQERLNAYNHSVESFFLIGQILIACACWIWLRWWIRDWLWKSSTLGRKLHILRTAGPPATDKIKCAVGVLLVLFVFLILQGEFKIIAALP